MSGRDLLIKTLTPDTCKLFAYQIEKEAECGMNGSIMAKRLV